MLVYPRVRVGTREFYGNVRCRALSRCYEWTRERNLEQVYRFTISGMREISSFIHCVRGFGLDKSNGERVDDASMIRDL